MAGACEGRVARGRSCLIGDPVAECKLHCSPAPSGFRCADPTVVAEDEGTEAKTAGLVTVSLNRGLTCLAD